MIDNAEYTRCLKYLNAERKFPIHRAAYIRNLKEEIDIARSNVGKSSGRLKVMTLNTELEKALVFLRFQIRFEESRDMNQEQALQYCVKNVAEYRRITWGQK